jgi:hypothetical protein
MKTSLFHYIHVAPDSLFKIGDHTAQEKRRGVRYRFKEDSLMPVTP